MEESISDLQASGAKDRTDSVLLPKTRLNGEQVMSFVKLFEEGFGLDRYQLGGKGYGLVEMTSIGLPVPPGLVITTNACKYYYAHNRTAPEGLFGQVKEKLARLEDRTGKKFGNPEKPLLLSVRSGAPPFYAGYDGLHTQPRVERPGY